MKLNKKWTIRSTIFGIFSGLMMLLLLLGGSPTLVLGQQISPNQIQVIVLAPNQRVVLKDANGTELGSGRFEANVSGRRDGQARGQAELEPSGLEFPNITIYLEFAEWQETRDGGVLLMGRSRVTYEDGHTETFPATVTVREGGTTTVPDCLIWDIPEPAILDGLNFETERSQLKFRER